MKKIISTIVLSLAFSATAMANNCDELPNHEALTKALKSVVKPTNNEINGGLELNMWGALVARDGTVCVVTRSGDEVGDQWPGSRVIAAQKANAANAFSLPGLALSTANLWTATQPGGSLYGLQFSNPVSTDIAYRGNAKKYGSAKDPMKGGRIGGVNVFGGGLALYNSDGDIIGALGVSGDTSCADHNIAWKTRDALKLDYVPAGVSATGDDNIIYEEGNGFAHSKCGGAEDKIAAELPKTHAISTKGLPVDPKISS